MKISASIIVKNETSCIETMLQSIMWIDEIVICDTGSDDNTIELAKKYTPFVYDDYKWNDNFAEARNHCLNKCTGDWILIIDADEVLMTPIEQIREEIEKAWNEKIINVKTKWKDSNEFHKSIRLFKRCPEIFWKWAIHNYINTTWTYEADIMIEYWYSEAHKKDKDRALRILLKEVTNDSKLVREKYYLAREYRYRKDYITALYRYDEYLKVANRIPEKADAYLMAARCLWNLHKWEQAREYCMKAIINNPNFKEALLFMWDISWKEQWDVFRKFAEIANNNNVLFVRK